MSGLAGIVLCGGRSTRMGQDKAQLAFRDGARVYTMQSWMQRRWSAHCEPLIWAGPGAGVHAVPDDPRFAGQGPIAGIHAGLAASMERGAGPWALLLAVDMPDFEPEWVNLLRGAKCEDAQAQCFEGGSLLGALVQIASTKALAQELLLDQERRLSVLTQRLAPTFRPPPPGVHPDALRSSMNRPQDFERWLSRRGFEPLK